MNPVFLKVDRSSIRISMPNYNSHLFLFSFLGFCFIKNLVNSQNSTLIFANNNNIRNCSCSTDIKNCDYSLANLMCNCKTVLFQTIDKTVSKLSYNGDLTIWFTDTSFLGLLLNFTFVHDLKLSLCGSNPLPTEYLALLGLRRLRVQVGTTEQSLTIYNSSDKKDTEKHILPAHEDWFHFHISYLDTSLFNGHALLKSYSVENVSSIKENFPNLPYSRIITNSSYVVTVIY
ncbi:exosomal polycystin-1-interacting protein isoform 1-T2 [Discoglossus pictus]